LRDYTSFNIKLVKSEELSLEVYSITGQKLFSNSFGKHPAGIVKIDLDATHLKSGLYLYKIFVGEKQVSGKITVFK
jgi:hypothetical protein